MVGSASWFFIICTVFGGCCLAVSASEANQDKIIKERMIVATCRAGCRDKFIADNGNSKTQIKDVQCENVPHCNMCWHTCHLFHVNFTLWGPMCTAPSICFTGCQVACAFHTSSSKFTKPVKVQPSWTFEVPMIRSFGPGKLLVNWVRPTSPPGKPNTSAIVYMILARIHSPAANSEWTEMLQTTEYSTVLEEIPAKKIEVKIIAMSAGGIIAEAVSSYKMNSMMPQDQSDPPSHEIDESSEEYWHMSIESMQLNSQLSGVDVAISWKPPMNGDILVIWEVIDGSFDITGHLYTAKSEITLTLSPNIVYRVQLEHKQTGRKSEKLIVDTKKFAVLIDQTLFRSSNVIEQSNGTFDFSSPIFIAGIASCLAFLGIAAIIMLILRCTMICVNARYYKQEDEENPNHNVEPVDVEVDTTIRDEPNQHSPLVEDKLRNLQVLMDSMERLAETFNPAYTNPAFVLGQRTPPPYSDHTKSLQKFILKDGTKLPKNQVKEKSQSSTDVQDNTQNGTHSMATV